MKTDSPERQLEIAVGGIYDHCYETGSAILSFFVGLYNTTMFKLGRVATKGWPFAEELRVWSVKNGKS